MAVVPAGLPVGSTLWLAPGRVPTKECTLGCCGSLPEKFATMQKMKPRKEIQRLLDSGGAEQSAIVESLPPAKMSTFRRQQYHKECRKIIHYDVVMGPPAGALDEKTVALPGRVAKIPKLTLPMWLYNLFKFRGYVNLSQQERQPAGPFRRPGAALPALPLERAARPALPRRPEPALLPPPAQQSRRPRGGVGWG